MPIALPTDDHVNGFTNGHANGHTNGYTNGHRNGYTNGFTNGHSNGDSVRSSAYQEPIAICGMAMRLPGGLNNAEEFWDVLYNGKDMRSPIPEDRYNATAFSDAIGKKGAIKTQHGYFLSNDLSCLDASFFSLTKTDLEKTDPQQRQILEVTRECLENAGEVDWRGKPIGCYVGMFGEDWQNALSKECQTSGTFAATGDLMMANRVSYEFDLKGPSLVIKTGCSASLVCLHSACRSLQSGDSDGAIVAGTSVIMGPYLTSAMTQQGVLSPEGSCKSFDASADGFARAEAINAVYIKRLDDAIRDGNPIRAVIRGSLSNSDGKSESLMAPNGESQEAMMRKVYHDTGLDPRLTAFVECHGTGTATGDPIETTAVGNVFGENGILIGSVKPNIGHSEGASGVNSLIKAVLALEHHTIPPNIKFNNPNPKIPFAEKNMQVPLEPTAWPEGRAERISINSFGIGGTNAHVVLDSLRQVRPDLADASTPKQSKNAQLMVLSANTPESLKSQVSNMQKYIEAHPERLADVAYTLSQRREHLPHRTFFVATEAGTAEAAPFSKAPRAAAPITMVFSGQGAQWAQMGKQLLASDPAFSLDIKAMDAVLSTLKHAPKWTIENELQEPAETSRINRAEFAQPLCTAIQIALVNSLERNGIHPAAVVGHSSGEIAAAYATGAITSAEAIIAAYYRGVVTKEQALEGGMAAIGLGTKDVSTYLEPGVVVACQNSPSSTTISGDLHRLRTVIEKVKAENPDVLARELKVDMAYHSHHMKGLASKYAALVEDELTSKGLTRSEPRVPLYSSVFDEVIEVSLALDAQYWASNLTSPVRFHPAVARRLRDQPQNVFLEIGPHATLAGPLRQICAESRATCVHVPTMLRSKDCAESLLSAFGQLYQHGITADFTALIPHGKVVSDLPPYAWDHTARFWSESRISRDWRFRPYGHHAILGQRVHENSGLTPTWRVMLDLEDEPWLYDHKVRDDIVFPFAGYVSMAGEAVRQLTGVDSGYSIRHAVAHTALVLSESKPVELVTTLRQHKLTDSNDSDSYEFVISSFNGSTWIKHCEGRVKPKTKSIPAPPRWQELSRKTSVPRWYDVMARVGLNYGPEFQGITELTASPTEPLAQGVITNPASHQEAPFLFHPAAIDSALQMVVAALTKIAARNFVQLAVPTLIEELDISRSATRMEARAWTSQDGKEMGLDVLADGEVAMRLRGARLTPLEDANALSDSDRHAGARLEWYPDFDFMDCGPLFEPPVAQVDGKRVLEELALLCLLDSEERVQGLHTDIEHFAKFREWLAREKYHAVTGQHPVIEDSVRYTKMSHEDRWVQIRDRMTTLATMPSVCEVAKGLLRICENTEKLFKGEVETIEILTEDNVLTEIYNAVSYGFGSFVRMLAISKPTLRILEVGAGTGGTTELILRDLASTGGNPVYSVYTFTDISAGFFPQARERFAYAPNMEYKAFDISISPFEQGFEPESYDLILANNVVHATPSLNATLLNLQPLLRPGGHLVLSEVCAVARAPGYIFGNFSGWWLGEPDNRKWEPYVQPDRWDVELKAVGFTGTDTVVYDAEPPYQYCAAIVSQKKTAPVDRGSCVTVLCERPTEGVSRTLIDDLQRAGFQVSTSRPGEPVAPNQDILSTLDLEAPFFDNISEENLRGFQSLLRGIKSQKLLWLMPHSQLRCDDPRSAQTVGAFRVARAELAAALNTLEIDAAEPDFSNLVLKMFNKVRASEDNEQLLPDREFGVDNGVIKIGRYQPFSLEQEVVERSQSGTGAVKRLEIGKPGLLDSLQWVEGAPQKVLGEHEVEVHTRAVGMNFRDIMVSMGVLSFGKSVPLGVELSGVVSRVGPKVNNVAVGDRVCAIAVEGCFSTQALLVDSLVHKIPDWLGFEEAATMVACYTTVFQALLDVGRLEKGQSILIHSAAGGIGYCAIRLCQLIGAEIYATVGNEQKAQHLVEHFNIPRNRIFNSRDDSFLSGVLRETDNQGVDIVLNSLSGELLHASWKCVAEFGKLIELGKRDLVGFGQLNMEPFLANRSYCCVDLAHAMKVRPQSVGRVMERWIWMYAQGLLTPISPMTVFEASDIEAGFRHLQKGDHIGKAVVRIPSEASEIPSVPETQECQLDPEAAYLLTGGTGGLGKSIATWMVEQGARELVFLSRSAGKSESDQAFFAELSVMGCKITGVAGRAEVMDDLLRAIHSASRPIKGVIHLAMVLRDAPMVDLTYEEWQGAVAPKVQGAWNIHNAFLYRKPLDFFVMTSSLVTLVDQPGQGNYAAANTFLESFTQYRHNMGLPASVLGICPIDDIGFVAEIPALRKTLKSQGLFFLPERELLDYMHLAILNAHPPTGANKTTEDITASWASMGYIIMGLRAETHLDDPNCPVSWRRDRRMGMYHNIPKETISGGDASASNPHALKSFLARAADEPGMLLDKVNTDFLAEEIGRRIFRFMMKPEEDLELGLSLPQIGMDSLMAIELRRWWKQAFGLDISVLEIMGAGTLEELGKVAGEALKKKFDSV